MIQRQQTLWLLLAAVAAILSYFFPFYSGEVLDANNAPIYTKLTAGSSVLLMIATGITALVGFAAIFLYKDRKVQIKTTLIGILLALVVLILFYMQMSNYARGTVAIWAIFPIISFIGFIMALRGIRKDEKLVKSLDKLR